MQHLQTQANAMGNATRHTMFDHVATAGHPVTVAELVDQFDLNHNTIRQHLAILVEAGLLRESTASPAGRGRPKLLYSVVPSAQSRWGAVGPYERLSMLLAEIIRTGDSPVEVGRRAGRRFQGLGSTADDGIEALGRAMAGQGFEATIETRPDGVDVVLEHCPFADVAVTDPDTVCELHRGMAEGVVENALTVTVDGLSVNDPRVANCRVHLGIGADRS